MRHLIISERIKALECQGAALVIRREQAPLQTIPLRRLETMVFLHSVSLPSRLSVQPASWGLRWFISTVISCAEALPLSHQVLYWPTSG